MRKKILSVILFLVIISCNLIPVVSLSFSDNNKILNLNKTENTTLQKNDYNKNQEDEDNYTEEYKEWVKLSDEEKAKYAVIPRKYKISFEEFFSDELNTPKSKKSKLLRNSLNISETQEIPESFDLRSKISIPVRNQSTYGLCWDFASMKSLETNLALHGYGDYDFSELHVDYLESEEFGTTYKLHNGRNFAHFEDYVANNYGPVLESEVPYNANYSVDDYNELLNMKSDIFVNSTVNFPSINNEYTEQELSTFRNAVKQHIMQNGSLYCVICSSEEGDDGRESKKVTMQYYNGKSVLNYQGTHYANHAVSIIGWDDNFSPDNFPEQCRPKEKGAYIAMNSWGEGELYNNHAIIYISYEDKYIEKSISGVVDAFPKELSNIYDKLERIEFNDINLYSEIKKILGRKVVDFDDENMIIYISKIALESIRYLDLKNKGINNINGIEKFSNVFTLDLSNNNIANIDNLNNPKINMINLENNKITDVSILSKQDNINLSNNPIESGLDKLENVSWLELNQCNLSETNLYNLINLSKLNYISLQGNNIENVECLENMNLYEINLSNNQGITGIEKLNNISTLILENCDLENEDIEKLNDLSKIDYLDLSNNKITNVSKLKETNISFLNLSGNRNIDLNTVPIRYNNQENEENNDYYCLILNNCNIENIEILKQSNIQNISLEGNPISDVSGLSEVTDIIELNLGNTNVTDVSPLKNIKSLYLNDNSGLYNIDKLSEVRFLQLKNCHLSDFSFINELNNLEEIYLNNNEIETFPILNNKEMWILDISDNKLEGIPDFSKINCSQILMKNNEIKNISNITSVLNMESLDFLDLSNNKIEEIPNINNNRIYINLDNNFIDNIPEGNNYSYENQILSGNYELELNKDNRISLPQILKNEVKNRYKNKTSFDTNNCSIDFKKGEIIINPNELENGEASIVVNSESYKCECKNTSFNISYEVKEKVNISNLEIGQSEYEKIYIEGERFDNSNLKINAVYENGLSYEVEDYEILNSQELSLGQNNVIIKYEGIEIQVPIQVYSNGNYDISFNSNRLYYKIKNMLLGDIAYQNDKSNRLIVNKAAIEQITELDLSQSDIYDFTGLSKIKNLKYLNLSGNNFIGLPITGVSVNENNFLEICKLEKLEKIELKNCIFDNGYYMSEDNAMLLLGMPCLKEIDFGEVKMNSHGYIEEKILYLPKYLTSSDIQNITVKFTYKNKQNEDVIEDMPIYIDENNKLYIIYDTEVTDNKIYGTRNIYIDIATEKIKQKLDDRYEFRENFVNQLAKIEVVTEPSKLSYRVGQNFDPSWMKVKATYNNGETREITNFRVEDGEYLSKYKKEVTISYEEDGITRTTTQPINVYTEDELVNVVFPDTNLYNEIKTGCALQDNPRQVRKNLIVDYDDENNTVQIVKNTLETVDNLLLMQKDITDLTGIRYFTGLRSIDLSFNTNLKTVNELLELDKLKMVDIHVTGVEDVKDLINKENIEQIILRKHEQNIINANTTEIELPQFMYQAVTEEDGVELEANIYYDTFSPEDGEYYNRIDGEKEQTEIIIDREKQKAIAKLNRQVTSEHDEGIRGLEVEVKGGKCNRALYIAFYNNIEEINVENSPNKTSYIVGQSFDRAGMKLMATYRDRSVSEINNYTVLDGDTLQEGQNFVTMSYTENGLTKTTTQEITVRNEEDEKIINDDSNYYTDETKILGISPDTSISEFINNFNETYRIIVIKNNSEVIEGAIGTGMEIRVLENDEEKARFTAIVIGDTDGDGKANVKDMVKINNYRLYGTITNFGEIYQTAADVNKDGKIDVKDMIRINNYRLYHTNLAN